MNQRKHRTTHCAFDPDRDPACVRRRAEQCGRSRGAGRRPGRAHLQGALPAFTQATGHKVEGTFDTIGVIERKLKAGEKADILDSDHRRDGRDDEGRIADPGSNTEIGRGTSGLAVRAGAPVPDISTPDALKKTLHRCALGRLCGSGGRRDQRHLFRPPARAPRRSPTRSTRRRFCFDRGYEVAQAVADGRAEIGNTSLTELAAAQGPERGRTDTGAARARRHLCGGRVVGEPQCGAGARAHQLHDHTGGARKVQGRGLVLR